MKNLYSYLASKNITVKDFEDKACIMWERSPFFGGCSYHNSEGDTVTGYYSAANPLEFEADCKQWTLNGHGSYESADAAMKAAE